MPMLMVHIGRVRMCVLESAMLVGVGMRFPLGGLQNCADAGGARHAHVNARASWAGEYVHVRGAPLDAAKHPVPSDRQPQAVER